MLENKIGLRAFNNISEMLS